MFLPAFKKKSTSEGFNMTPLIDVVFLLIIFFMLVLQFIKDENLKVELPKEITNAIESEQSAEGKIIITVTIENGEIVFAVGAERIDTSATKKIPNLIKTAIDKKIEVKASENPIVTLRVSKGITFRDYQYALAGIAQSEAADIQLSVIKEEI